MHLRFGIEGLVADTVPALMLRLVDIASLLKLGEEVFHSSFVVVVGGPHEAIVRNVGFVRQILELLRVHCTEDTGVRLRLFCRFLHLHAMLVRACQEYGVTAASEKFPSFEYVCKDEGVEVADVRLSIDIVYRSCYIVWFSGRRGRVWPEHLCSINGRVFGSRGIEKSAGKSWLRDPAEYARPA
jgi:hypothetical protein